MSPNNIFEDRPSGPSWGDRPSGPSWNKDNSGSMVSLDNELVFNSGFEVAGSSSVFSSWLDGTLVGNSTINRDTSVFYSGISSCRFDIDGSGNQAYIGQPVTLIPGARYRFSYWQKTSTGNNMVERINFNSSTEPYIYLHDDGTFGDLYFLKTLQGDGTWTNPIIEFVVPVGYSTFYIWPLAAASGWPSQTYDANKSVWFDNISLIGGFGNIVMVAGGGGLIYTT
jgi:hypothetical protein